MLEKQRRGLTRGFGRGHGHAQREWNRGHEPWQIRVAPGGHVDLDLDVVDQEGVGVAVRPGRVGRLEVEERGLGRSHRVLDGHLLP